MKRFVVLAVLTLALPLAAFAKNVDFGNTGGTLAGSSAGLSLTGSELTQISGLLGPGITSTFPSRALLPSFGTGLVGLAWVLRKKLRS